MSQDTVVKSGTVGRLPPAAAFGRVCIKLRYRLDASGIKLTMSFAHARPRGGASTAPVCELGDDLPSHSRLDAVGWVTTGSRNSVHSRQRSIFGLLAAHDVGSLGWGTNHTLDSRFREAARDPKRSLITGDGDGEKCPLPSLTGAIRRTGTAVALKCFVGRLR